MRRVWIAITISVFAIVFLCGCCVSHDWELATCTAPKTCKKCGMTEGEPLPHEWKAATCSMPSTCLVCGTVDGEALGHSDSDWIIDTEPTCTQEGSKHIECTVCNEVLKSEPMPSSGHTEGDIIIDVEPTCTSVGYKHEICGVCGETIYEWTIPESEHVYGDWIIDEEETCTDTGLKHRNCELCNHEEMSKIVAKGHSYGAWIVDKKATCTKDGAQHRDCSKCGEREKQVLNATGHTPEGIKCSVCGDYVIDICKVGKSYKDAYGLTVTLNSFKKSKTDGYTTYYINYTLKNNTKNKKLSEGFFLLFLTDGSYEPQYGFFNDLFPGDSITREHTWKVLNSQSALVLEYFCFDPNEAFTYGPVPDPNMLHWAKP